MSDTHGLTERNPPAPERSDRDAENDDLFRRRNQVQDDLRRAQSDDLGVEGGHRARRRLERELQDLMAQILLDNEPLVTNYVRSFRSRIGSHQTQDLVAAGREGLFEAALKFEVHLSGFSSFARVYVRRAVLGAVRQQDHPGLSQRAFNNRPRILQELTSVVPGTALSVAYERISAKVHCSVDQVQRVCEEPTVVSLDVPEISSRVVNEPDLPFEESLREAIVQRWAENLVDDHITYLDARELFVIVRRFGLDTEPEQKLAPIGEILGLSKETVRKIILKALQRMRNPPVLRRFVMIKGRMVSRVWLSDPEWVAANPWVGDHRSVKRLTG